MFSSQAHSIIYLQSTETEESVCVCSCSAIAQTLYTARHDRKHRPLYYAILKTFEITNNEEDEEDETIPWYRELQPKCCVESKEVKVLWNIPLHLDVVPKDGANKPDIAICNKKERQWLFSEGTVCNIGQIQERDRLKTEKYADCVLPTECAYLHKHIGATKRAIASKATR